MTKEQNEEILRLADAACDWAEPLTAHEQVSLLDQLRDVCEGEDAMIVLLRLLSLEHFRARTLKGALDEYEPLRQYIQDNHHALHGYGGECYGDVALRFIKRMRQQVQGVPWFLRKDAFDSILKDLPRGKDGFIEF